MSETASSLRKLSEDRAEILVRVGDPWALAEVVRVIHLSETASAEEEAPRENVEEPSELVRYAEVVNALVTREAEKQPAELCPALSEEPK